MSKIARTKLSVWFLKMMILPSEQAHQLMFHGQIFWGFPLASFFYLLTCNKDKICFLFWAAIFSDFWPQESLLAVLKTWKVFCPSFGIVVRLLEHIKVNMDYKRFYNITWRNRANELEEYSTLLRYVNFPQNNLNHIMLI